MVHGANTFTLKCDSSNNRYDFGTWGSKSSPEYREFNFSYCLDTYFTLKKTVLILVFECGSSYRKFKNFWYFTSTFRSIL